MPLAPLALGLCLASAPACPDTAKLVSLLEATRCDDAFLLLSGIKVPEAANCATEASAILRAEAACRTQDAMLALEFSALAARLAPIDDEVQVAYAEALIGLDQREAAAQVLDQIMRLYPADMAPRAWLLRGKLASQDQDHALVERALSPLASDPAYMAEVVPLLVKSRAELAKKADEERRITDILDAVRKTMRDMAGSSKDAPGDSGKPGGTPHVPGAVVAEFPGSVGNDDEVRLKVTGLVRGRLYQFRATGTCAPVMKQTRQVCDDEGNCYGFGMSKSVSLSSIDFRVQIGDEPSRPLLVGGQDRSEESRVSFVATGTEVNVRVYDDSSLSASESWDCTVTNFSVVAE
ncbi:MAG: tetratricopeptide repeat protein [Myxococcales bacterium]|jgi:hypothetical protein